MKHWPARMADAAEPHGPNLFLAYTTTQDEAAQKSGYELLGAATDENNRDIHVWRVVKAKVEPPEAPKEQDLPEISAADMRIETFRAGGSSGWINKPPTAVRITHIPTGIVAECDTDRSQHANKATALKILATKLKRHSLPEASDADLAHLFGKDIRHPDFGTF